MIKYLISVFFMLSIYLIFLTVFFFTVGVAIEKISVRMQAENILQEYSIIADDNFKKKMCTWISGIKASASNRDNKKIDDKNRDTTTEAMKLIGIISACSLSLAILLLAFSGTTFSDVKDIIRENLTLIVAVAITEILFVVFVSRHYLTLPPETIRRVIICSAIDPRVGGLNVNVNVTNRPNFYDIGDGDEYYCGAKTGDADCFSFWKNQSQSEEVNTKTN
jgi:hypothetical protein